MGSSGLRQRELTGGSEDEHRTGLPIPETWHSWEEEGESEKAAAGNMKEKLSQTETLGGRRRREAGRESLQVQGESIAPSSCKLGPTRKPEPWLSAHVDSKSWSPLFQDSV